MAEGGIHSGLSSGAVLRSCWTAKSKARAQWHLTQVSGHEPSAGAEADSEGEHASGTTRSRMPPVLAHKKPTSRMMTKRRTTSFIAFRFDERQTRRIAEGLTLAD